MLLDAAQKKEMVIHENVVPPWQKHGATIVAFSKV
jgi:hypothetical protein